jgi:hypothetical protein
MLVRILIAIILLAGSLWAQTDTSGAAAAATGTGGSTAGMLTPAPVSGEGYSMGFTSETRSNYLRGGLTFGSAYDTDATTGANGQAVSEVSYTVSPTISLDQTRSRFHWLFNYSPGFTFYQKTSALNQANQNLGVNLSYRLSPHVTLSLRDSFLKTSNVLNQSNQDFAQPVSGSVFVPNSSVIAPLADVLSNTASASLTYQFSPDGMVGARGTFGNLHYPNQAQVPGLGDSSSRAGSAFYNRRLSKMHYIGATYQYQNFLAYPTIGQSETTAHSVYLFYTLYLKPTVSISLFGGPQYSQTQQFGLPTTTGWSPAGGASMGWQGRLTSFALSASRAINDSGGLAGAVQAISGNASVRRQLTRNLSASVGGSYADNNMLDPLSTLNTSGHTVSGNASVQRQVGEHFNLQLQYMHLHQSYGDVVVLSAVPNRDRVAVNISYQFSRPLGR